MKKFFSALAVLLCATFLPHVLYEAEAETESATDFSRPGYENTQILAADFLENYLGFDLYTREREFLNSQSDFAVKYSDRIAGKYIFSEYSEADSNVLISADDFEYVTANGAAVKWTPYKIGNKFFNGNLCEVSVSGEDFVSVTYKTELMIAYEPINSILNSYYTEAESVYEKLSAYEEDYKLKLAQFYADEDLYNRYLDEMEKYDKAVAEHNKYLRDLEEWNRKNSDYQRYCEEYSNYLNECEEYEAYKELQRQYLAKLKLWQESKTEYDNYEKEYNKFLEALKDPRVAKARKQLDILEYLDVPANGRTLSGAIMGNAVNTVFSRLGELDDDKLRYAKVDRDVIDLAEKSTRNLRDQITKYQSCTSEEERYIFYISNYDALKVNLTELLRTLDNLYLKPVVLSEIEKNNRIPQFRILLAQLYEICNALDNGVIGNYEKTYYSSYPTKPGKRDFDANYRIDGLTPSEILGGVVLVDDNDAVPLDTGVPNIPVEPQKPSFELPPAPEAPGPEPAMPVPPSNKADNPGPPPQEVLEPVRPDEVKQPEKPEKYVPSEWEDALYGEFKDGGVKKRHEYSSPVKIVCYKDVVKYFRNSKTIIVSFYLSEDDEEPVYVTESEAGSYAEYLGTIPVKEKRGYTCVFDGWMDKTGRKVDLEKLPLNEGDIKLYPHFNETPVDCEVIWVIDGEEIRDSVKYGETPEYDGIPQKSDDADGRQYRFSGWDRILEPVEDFSVRYTAEFEKSYLVRFKVDGNVTVVSVWSGETAEYPGSCVKEADEYYYYTFKSWDRKIIPAESDQIYTAVFIKNYIFKLRGGGARVVKMETGDYYVDCSRTDQNSFEISKLVEIVHNDNAGATIEFTKAVLSFNSGEVAALANGGAKDLKISITQKFSYQYDYRVDIFSDSGTEFAFTFKTYGVFDDTKTHLFRIDGEGKGVETRVNISGDAIVFAMTSGYTYEIYPLFVVTILESDGISAINPDANLVKPNQKVTLALGELSAGRTFEYLYVLDAEGNSVEVSPEGSFKMPQSDVVVGAVCGYLEYTVTFKADGKIISEREYRYGDTVEAPSMAYKSPDGEYSYIFIGWDREILPVTGNAEYIALFAAEPLPVVAAEEPSGKIKLFIWVLNNLEWVCSLLAVFIVSVVTGIVLIILQKRKDKNKTVKDIKNNL